MVLFCQKKVGKLLGGTGRTPALSQGIFLRLEQQLVLGKRNTLLLRQVFDNFKSFLSGFPKRTVSPKRSERDSSSALVSFA